MLNMIEKKSKVSYEDKTLDWKWHMTGRKIALIMNLLIGYSNTANYNLFWSQFRFRSLVQANELNPFSNMIST